MKHLLAFENSVMIVPIPLILPFEGLDRASVVQVRGMNASLGEMVGKLGGRCAIDSISVNPDSFVAVKGAVAAAERREVEERRRARTPG